MSNFRPFTLLMILAAVLMGYSLVAGSGGNTFGLILVLIGLGIGGYILQSRFHAMTKPAAYINYLHARNYLEQRKLQLALEHLDKALALNPSLRPAQVLRSAVLLQMGRPGGVVNNIDELMKQNPRDISLYKARIALNISQEKYGSVVMDANQMINIDPSVPEGYLFRAYARHRLEQYELALPDYKQFVSRVPGHAPALVSLGEVYFHLGDIENAQQAYTQAIASISNFGPAYSNRGFLLAAYGDVSGGMADAQKGVEYSPKEPGVYYNRGCIYAILGEYENAFADFQKALEIKLDYSHAVAATAITHYLAGSREQAQTIWKQLILQEEGFADWEWVRERFGWTGDLKDAAQNLVGMDSSTH